jgi:mannosyltransferase
VTTSSATEPDGTAASDGAAAPDRTGTSQPGRAGASRAGASRWRALGIRSAPVLAAGVAMTGFGLWGLARDSAMGNDEVVSRWAALLSLGQLVHLVRHVDAVHALYYLLLHFWVVVGTSPTAIRVPSLIAMVVGAVLMVIVARRLTGSGWVGLFAGLIMVVTPSISYYAQTARSYALVFACVLGSTLALLNAMAAEKAGEPKAIIVRRWLIYGALVTLGGYLNEMSLLALAANAITVVLARYGRRAIVHWLRTAVVAALLVTPLIVVSIKESGALNWVSRPDLHQVWILYHDYFGATLWAPILVAVCAAVAVAPPPGTWRKRHGSTEAPGGNEQEAPWWRSGISLPSVALPLLFIPAALLMLESLVAPPLYVDRYVLYGEAGAALLAAAGLYRIGRWIAKAAHQPDIAWAPGVVVCVCALLLQLAPQQNIRTGGSRLYNFGGPAFYLAANAHRGDGVLFFGDFYRKAELGYPVQFRKTRDIAEAESPAVANPYKGIDKPFSAIRPIMLADQRIWVLGRRPAAGLPAGPMQQESTVLLHYFNRTVARGYRGMWLTLWVRR